MHITNVATVRYNADEKLALHNESGNEFIASDVIYINISFTTRAVSCTLFDSNNSLKMFDVFFCFSLYTNTQQRDAFVPNRLGARYSLTRMPNDTLYTNTPGVFWHTYDIWNENILQGDQRASIRALTSLCNYLYAPTARPQVLCLAVL